MGYDLLPPMSAMLAAFASKYPGEHKGRETPLTPFQPTWFPARIEQMPVSDSAVTDLMQCLGIPRTQIPVVREGDWVRVVPKGGTAYASWTIRRIYDNDDGGFYMTGVVPT